MSKKPQLQRVLEEIKSKLGIERTRIYEKAKEAAARAQVNTETGIYLVAAQAGVNLSRILPREKVDEIRELVFQTGQGGASVRAGTGSKKLVQKNVTITVGKTFTVNDPILPERVITEAKAMAEGVYPLLYVFENSVRELILRVMRDAHGDDWWDAKVSKPVRETVAGRMDKETENPWHGKRGAHPIFYTDLPQLALIVQNNWANFKSIIPSIGWLSQKLEEIGHSRNPAMHMNPLAKRDIARIKVYFHDWESQILAKRSHIPGS